MITGYKIKYKPSNKDSFHKKSVNSSILSLTLGKLRAYTEYHIDIAAKSSKGQGPFSDIVVVTTDQTGNYAEENSMSTSLMAFIMFFLDAMCIDIDFQIIKL